MIREKAVLALSNGEVFYGTHIGAPGFCEGEVVFNTSMTGYQEILTDPSYCKQIITFTAPQIGNVGVNSEDMESAKAHAKGVIIRELSPVVSNRRGRGDLNSWLMEENVVGICGIDTRSLVFSLREGGSQMGVICSGNCDENELLNKAKSLPGMQGRDLVKEVTCESAYAWTKGVWRAGSGFDEYSPEELSGRPHVVVLDFGVKFNILRLLVDKGFRVTVVPAHFGVDEILSHEPNGIMLTNGPGDPAAVGYAIETVKGIVGKLPIFGICLGHQILGLALDVPTFKLKFGHRGGNHPVRNERTKKVEITAQNHGFASEKAKSGVSHLNLNDKTISGFDIPDKKAFSVQYHPEASPGPRDSEGLFEKFYDVVICEMNNA